MTESEWLACDDLEPLLGSLHARGAFRKLRLFACACCRRLDRLLDQTGLGALLDRLERWADETGATRTLLALHRDILSREGTYEPGTPPRLLVRALGSAALVSITGTDAHNAAWLVRAAEQVLAQETDEANALVEEWSHDLGGPPRLEADRYAAGLDDYAACIAEVTRDEQLRLLRCIAGNPFEPARADPAWREWQHGTVVGLARTIYEEPAFEQMPVLADALEDAGCTNEAILAHCRQDTAHARGCWVLDMLRTR
jgi:hypothetical protein